MWLDPPKCPTAAQDIPMLLKKMKWYESRMSSIVDEELEDEERAMDVKEDFSEGIELKKLIVSELTKIKMLVIVLVVFVVVLYFK